MATAVLETTTTVFLVPLARAERRRSRRPSTTRVPPGSRCVFFSITVLDLLAETETSLPFRRTRTTMWATRSSLRERLKRSVLVQTSFLPLQGRSSDSRVLNPLQIARKEAEVEAGISTSTMQSQGTKKRKVLKDSAKRGGKRRRGSTATDSQLLGTASDANGSMSDDEGSSRAGSSVRASSERQASTIPTDAEMSDATASDVSPVKKQRPMAKPRFQTAPSEC